ncbi:MAG: TonB-dependent receptor [Saprospiraceae bacterium]|nr:TonB-dependent receptor [Saprospiraceae bacterium]MBK8298744.1 TonB-dependent receptor [Saprospiraceae bacterium]
MNTYTIIFTGLFLFQFAIAIAHDTIPDATLKEVIIIDKLPVPERLNDIEETALFSGKKNEVIRLSKIDANLTTNNSRQIFSRVPGVSIWENDGSGIQIAVGVRGLNPNRSWEFNTRQNGYDISSDVFGYPESYYNPPMEAVEKIQIVRGGAALQFGPQFGGLLNYILKRENGDKPFTFQSQNTLGSNGLISTYNSISGKTKKISYNVFNQSRKGNGWRQNGRYEVSNSYAFLKYKFSENTSISAEYTNMAYEIQQSGGLTDVQFKQNSQQSVRQRNWFSAPWNLFALNFDTKISNKLSLNTKVFALIAERNSIGFLATPNIKDSINIALNDYNNRQVDRDEYKNIGAELRMLYQYKLGKLNNNLAIGARYYIANTTRRQKGKGDTGFDYNIDLLTDKFPTDLEFTTDNIALFAENQIKITDKFSITPGFRIENIVSKIKGRLNIEIGADVNVIPQTISRQVFLSALGAQYKLNTTNFYANFSQAYRPVLFSDMVPPATTDVIDQNLKDANGYNMDFGYRGSLFSDVLDFDVSYFWIQYNDRIGIIRRYADNDPTKATYQFRTNLGKSFNTGFEAYVNLNISKVLHIQNLVGNINVFASLAFIDAKYSDFKTTKITGTAPNVIIIEENLKNKLVEYAPKNIHNIGLSYNNDGFTATIQTRISSSVFTDATNTETPNATGTNGKVEGYNIYDLSVEYRFLKNYNVRVGLNNMFDEIYATRRAGGNPGPGLIPGEGRAAYISVGIKL